MKRTVILTIEVAAKDKPFKDRREDAEMAGVSVCDLQTLKDVAPAEIGHIVAEAIPVLNEQFFEGTDLYARFTAAKLIRAKWKP